MNHWTRYFKTLLLLFCISSSQISQSAPSESYLGLPPFINTTAGKPNIILILDTSASMLRPAYMGDGGGWPNTSSSVNDFDPGKTYYGYFNSGKNYEYVGTPLPLSFSIADFNNPDKLCPEANPIPDPDGHFKESGSGKWDGNFLNWLTMTRMDVARKVLTGGRVIDRSTSPYRLQLQNTTRIAEANGYCYKKSYVDSDLVGDFSDKNVAFTIKKGVLISIGNTATEMFKLEIETLNEPTGLIQSNSETARFGVAVYNYDHTQEKSHDGYLEVTVVPSWDNNPGDPERDPTTDTDGATLYPCYGGPSFTCLRTDPGFNSPENVIEIVDKYTVMESLTPLAESLLSVYAYVNQNSSALPLINNGSSGVAPYDTSWDIYDYPSQPDLYCARVFTIMITDGEHRRDDSAFGLTGNLPEVSVSTADSGGNRLVLAEVAEAVRKNDCRSDLVGHQEIFSYYMLASFGGINATAEADLIEAAKYGSFSDDNNDHICDDCNQSAVAGTVRSFDTDADGSVDGYFSAEDGAAMETQLSAVLSSIRSRSSSVGSSSISAASASGEGAIIRADFSPTTSGSSGTTVRWVGDVTALFIDDKGLLRSDDGDKILEDFVTDPIVDTCFSADLNSVLVKLSTTEASRPSSADYSACLSTTFSNSSSDIGYLWTATDWLNSSDLDANITAQRTYTTTGNQRYLFYGFDRDTTPDGVVSSVSDGKDIDFVSGSFGSSEVGILNIVDSGRSYTTAALVNYIRGEDQTGMRPRALASGRTARLGDIAYSAPTLVGRPAEALDLIYGDEGYGEFIETYKNRRQMVYVGANDGMLHAFNAGSYYLASGDTSKKYHNGPNGKTQYPLGMELWAYIPYNALPHLKLLPDLDYGQNSKHLYFVDGEPRVFDAQIFSDDTTHPNGWGTVLVIGMRLGGGEITVDVDSSATVDSRTTRSAYIILDITDPEQAPELIMEFSHADLGFTTMQPTPIKDGNDWYLLIGSGPDNSSVGVTNVTSSRPGKLFLLDLKTKILEPDFGTSGVLTLTEAESFIASPVAVDFDQDYTTDAVYFGTASGTTSGSFGGKLYRLQIENSDSSTKAVSTWAATVLYDMGKPITAKPAVTFDRKQQAWVLVGSGRLLSTDDNSDTSDQLFVGVKEPEWGTVSGLVDITNIQIQVVTSAVINGPTGVSTFSDLETYFIDSATSGWKQTLTSGNRVIGEAAVLGSNLNFTSYQPNASLGNACALDGLSQLFVTNFSTGSASSTTSLGTISYDNNGTPISVFEKTLDIGIAPATSPSLHTGSNYGSPNQLNALIQTATGEVITVGEETSGKIQSGKAGWRAMK